MNPFLLLSRSEQAVVCLLLDPAGYSVKEIATKLDKATHTIDVQRTCAFRKMVVHNRSGLIHLAYKWRYGGCVCVCTECDTRIQLGLINPS